MSQREARQERERERDILIRRGRRSLNLGLPDLDQAVRRFNNAADAFEAGGYRREAKALRRHVEALRGVIKNVEGVLSGVIQRETEEERNR